MAFLLTEMTDRPALSYTSTSEIPTLSNVFIALKRYLTLFTLVIECKKLRQTIRGGDQAPSPLKFQGASRASSTPVSEHHNLSRSLYQRSPSYSPRTNP